jgi:hypothetical protein
VAFPLADYRDFNSNPILLSTRDINSLNNFSQKSDRLFPGDIIILASDALASFILKNKDLSPWGLFMQLFSGDSKKREKEEILNNWKKIKEEWEKTNHGSTIDKFSDLVFQPSVDGATLEEWSFNNWIFNNWIEQQRDLGYIKNDDVTLYLIKLKDEYASSQG